MDNQQHLDDEIFFPVNVKAGFEYVEGLGAYEFKRYILPAGTVVLGLALIPPYTSILFWIFKIFVALLATIFCIFFITIKPVQSRKNISLEEWLREQMDYSKRQKVYFINEKDRKFHGK